MKGKYKKKKIWCSACDGELVEVGTKCTNCGNREYSAKIKKPNQHQILNGSQRLCKIRAALKQE